MNSSSLTLKTSFTLLFHNIVRCFGDKERRHPGCRQHWTRPLRARCAANADSRCSLNHEFGASDIQTVVRLRSLSFFFIIACGRICSVVGPTCSSEYFGLAVRHITAPHRTQCSSDSAIRAPSTNEPSELCGRHRDRRALGRTMAGSSQQNLGLVWVEHGAMQVTVAIRNPQVSHYRA